MPTRADANENAKLSVGMEASLSAGANIPLCDVDANTNANMASLGNQAAATVAPSETESEKIERIKRELDHVPLQPGVYLWKDEEGTVIYVGKAKQLRARMRQYVNFQDDRAKIPLLVSRIHSFDYVVVNSEHESLVLERNLIAQYSPFFNADFKDDKSYPFIALTTDGPFPAIKYTREKHKKGVKYFGPYTDSRAARATVDIVRRVVPLCAATCADWRRLVASLQKQANTAGTQENLAHGHVGAVEGQANAADAEESSTHGHEGAVEGQANAADAKESSARGYVPSQAPSQVPSQAPLQAPSQVPSQAPLQAPSQVLSQAPLQAPSRVPSGKPCFDCHVGLGPGACCGRITPEAYEENVKRVEHFLSGHHDTFIEELTADMRAAAADLDFERAGRLKARLEVLQQLCDKQRAVSSRDINADVFGVVREETITGVHVLVVREGRIIANNEFIMNKGNDVPDYDLAHMLLLRYYQDTDSIPHEVFMETLPDDAESLQEWLTEKLQSVHGAKVTISTPKKGEKADLLTLATKNAHAALLRYKVRTNYDDKRTNDALVQLESALALDGAPLRIECFDISTIHGSYTVASMVVFTAGVSDKKQYRRFKIKTLLTEANDFASMQEVVERRYCPERMADTRFGSKPDLIILDGGLPQLNAVKASFERMGITDIALVGLAKRDEELFVTWKDDGPVVLPSGSPSLYLVKQIRDEAHRFAITFHRELRGKGMLSSVLDSVAGVGPTRKKKLISHFGSLKKMCNASLAELQDAHILPAEVAQELYLVLQDYQRTHASNSVSRALAEQMEQAELAEPTELTDASDGDEAFDLVDEFDFAEVSESVCDKSVCSKSCEGDETDE